MRSSKLLSFILLSSISALAACGGQVSTDDTGIDSVAPGKGHGSTSTTSTGPNGTVLADFDGIFSASAIDDDAVYVALEDASVNGKSRIVRVAKNGGATTTVTSTSVFVEGLVVDADYVYFTTLVDGEIRRVAKLGGASEVLASGQKRPWGLAGDATNLYWASQGDEGSANGTIAVMPKAGGAVRTLASAQESATEIAVSSDAVYWSKGPWGNVNGEIRRIAIDGSGAPSALSTGLDVVSSLRIDASRIAWTSGPTIYVTPLAGGAIDTIPTTQATYGDSTLQSALLDGDAIFYGDDSQTASHGEVTALSLAGDPSAVVMAPAAPGSLVTGWMTSLEADASSIYAFDYYAGQDGAHARIRVAPKQKL